MKPDPFPTWLCILIGLACAAIVLGGIASLYVTKDGGYVQL